MEDKTIFTVREVAQMLSTSEETVRRWIRDGKLVASLTSRKGGNQITEEALEDFFSKNKKYQRVIGKMAGIAALTPLIPGIGAVVGGIAGVKISTDEAVIDHARQFYQANKVVFKSNNDFDVNTNLEETAQSLVKNAQDSLNFVQIKLESAKEKRNALDKEIEELEVQQQLALNTLKIAKQTLAGVSEPIIQRKKSDSDD